MLEFSTKCHSCSQKLRGAQCWSCKAMGLQCVICHVAVRGKNHLESGRSTERPPPPFTFTPYRRLSTLPSNQLSKLQSAEFSSLRKHPFLLALRRWGRYVRNILKVAGQPNPPPPHPSPSPRTAASPPYLLISWLNYRVQNSLACEKIRFSSLGEERGETDVFAG